MQPAPRRIAPGLCRLLVLAILLAAGSAAGEPSGHRARRVAPRHVANMPPGWTWPPSAEMRADGQRCLARLDALGVRWQAGPRTRKVVTPVLLLDLDLGGVRLIPLVAGRSRVMDCHLAEALAVAAGSVLRDLGITELRFRSIYVYRTVDGKRALSRHAIGLAIDVYEVMTGDGEVHRVSHDYRPRGSLLRRLEERLRASRWFRGPLTPGTDRDHRDHFHLEARTPAERETPPTS